jgi:bacterioferritin
MKSAIITNLDEIRRRAREHVTSGAVTSHYHADREKVVALLNEALATEIVCVLRYRRHYYMASGIDSLSVAGEFKEHADEEEQHVAWIAARIVELNGEPNLDPRGLAERATTDYAPGTDLVDMIKEDLIAERIVIDSYTEIIRFLGNDDPTTRRLVERILEQEEEHAEDLASLLGAGPGKPAVASVKPPLAKTG